MSTSGNPNLRTSSWRVTRQLLNRPTSGSEAEMIAHGMKTWRIIGSPDYPPTDEELRAKLLRSLRRSIYPAGYRNQMAAIAENGDRRTLLAKITTPTLVIHGKADVLVPVDGGIDTAKHIPDAELKLIEGMGHDIPKELVPKIVRLISGHVSKASS